MVNVFDLPCDANSNLKKAAIQNTAQYHFPPKQLAEC